MTEMGSAIASRLIGRAVDTALGFTDRATPYDLTRDVPAPMPDGTALVGDLYRPRAETGPLPVVLLRCPYGRAGLTGLAFAAPIARRGFQVFIQSTRGTFGSGGQFRPFSTEREDGLATLDWLREQSWCDGRVATVGASYLGHTQWAVVPYADPPILSFSPHVTAAKITHAFYDHGAPGLRNALGWSTSIGRQERSRLPGQLDLPLLARLRKTMARLPLQAADVAVNGAPVAFWRDFVEHADPADSFWDHTDHSGVDMGALPPANMVTGWWDLFLVGQLSDFAALRAAGNDARILVGPWLHGEPGELKASLTSDVAFLRHHLDGGPAPEGPRVKVQLQQTDQWLGFEAWPPPGVEPATVHLGASGGLTVGSPPPHRASSGFRYDPHDPTPSVGGPLLQAPGKQADNRASEARPDVLVFTGDRLVSDLDVVGEVSARVFVTLDREHADVFVRLCDVDEKGVSRNVVDGIRRLSPASVPADDVSRGDDGVLAVDIELFPTAYRFRAGHRLRVQVAGGAFPRYAPNLGTGEPLATATKGIACEFRVHHDAAHPSAVTFARIPALADLPVVTRPGGSAPT